MMLQFCEALLDPHFSEWYQELILYTYVNKCTQNNTQHTLHSLVFMNMKSSAVNFLSVSIQKPYSQCVMTNSSFLWLYCSLSLTEKTVSVAGDSLPRCKLVINSSLLRLPASHLHWTWANISIPYVFIGTSWINRTNLYFTGY